jgi:hypothetical protein
LAGSGVQETMGIVVETRRRADEPESGGPLGTVMRKFIIVLAIVAVLVLAVIPVASWVVLHEDLLAPAPQPAANTNKFTDLEVELPKDPESRNEDVSFDPDLASNTDGK